MMIFEVQNPLYISNIYGYMVFLIGSFLSLMSFVFVWSSVSIAK